MNELARLAAPSREPQQGRSKASYERMLGAAEKLMVAKGSDDFSLTEVSKTGKVSIGSIYLRFNSKDELIRAVQSRVLARIGEDQNAMLAAVQHKACALEEFMMQFVDAFAELLNRHAAILRPIMLRATYDRAVSGAGKISHDAFAGKVGAAILEYRDALGCVDPERRVNAAYRVIYATIARYLGLGSSNESSGEGNWAELKEDLGTMCASFLTARP